MNFYPMNLDEQNQMEWESMGLMGRLGHALRITAKSLDAAL
jgi:hypothetical protein